MSLPSRGRPGPGSPEDGEEEQSSCAALALHLVIQIQGQLKGGFMSGSSLAGWAEGSPDAAHGHEESSWEGLQVLGSSA